MHVCLREREGESEGELNRERKGDLVCQGCCVSNVVVEPLQCTKTKGREGVRVRGWEEGERDRDGEREKDREKRESQIQRERRYQGREQEGQTWRVTGCETQKPTCHPSGFSWRRQ